MCYDVINTQSSLLTLHHVRITSTYHRLKNIGAPKYNAAFVRLKHKDFGNCHSMCRLMHWWFHLPICLALSMCVGLVAFNITPLRLLHRCQELLGPLQFLICLKFDTRLCLNTGFVKSAIQFAKVHMNKLLQTHRFQ